MISVAEARAHVLALVAKTPLENVPLRAAAGRVLAKAVTAERDQPPFAASAMDGYAIVEADAVPGRQLRVIGEIPAGQMYAGTLTTGDALRIFTGAPLPKGADRVIIQEDVQRSADTITLTAPLDAKPHVRPAGADFTEGFTLPAPRLLGDRDIALLAAMNIATVPLRKRPSVALLATGDELVMPGETPRPDQIIASNIFGLEAMLARLGAEVRVLPIARDRASSLETAFDMARGADVLITIGGASVGDYDIVGQTAATRGLEQAFYKIAMRPGKPLMAGRMGDMAVLGLPGNPVSAMVCGHIFARPMIQKMLGLATEEAAPRTAPLTHALPQNGPRAHYMRATLNPDGTLTPNARQDSALLTVLADSTALIIRPPNDPTQPIGARLNYIPFE